MSKPFDQLRQVTDAYQESSLLAAAAELDLFTELLKQGNKLSATELAESLAADLRGMTVLLDALTAAGYLLKTGSVYSVVEKYAELLDSRTPATYIPMIRHIANVQRGWTQISVAVKTGKPADVPPSILGEAEDRKSFIWAMNSVARTLAEPSVESLRQVGLLSFKKMIDIGGASGTYTEAFLKALPDLEATVFDLPVGVAAARKRFGGSVYESRVHLVEGDIFKNDFPTGFDFAWISAIIHQFDRNGSRTLYRKTLQSLNPGGKIAIRDFVMSTDRTSPRAGTLFGINMLVETQNGMVYTFEEIKEDLESVGFTDVRLAVPDETMSAVVVAVKPRS